MGTLFIRKRQRSYVHACKLYYAHPNAFVYSTLVSMQTFDDKLLSCCLRVRSFRKTIELGTYQVLPNDASNLKYFIIRLFRNRNFRSLYNTGQSSGTNSEIVMEEITVKKTKDFREQVNFFDDNCTITLHPTNKYCICRMYDCTYITCFVCAKFISSHTFYWCEDC